MNAERRLPCSRPATLLLLVGTLLAVMCAVTGSAHAKSAPEVFVPKTATAAQVAAAQPGQRYLVGISKDYPPICDGITDAKVEQTRSTTNSDRVDVGTPVIELAGLKPDTSYSYCFFIQNVGNKPMSFRISTTELVGVNDPKTKQQLIRPPKSVGTWIHPVGTKFTLEPGERQYVPYTIDVPHDPPAGTSAGAVEVVRLEGSGGDVAGAGFYISTLHKVVITFPGGSNRKLEVGHVRAPHVLSPENGHKSYVLRFDVHNVGTMVDVHRTKLAMKGLGRTVAAAETADSVLLPDGAEQVELRVKDMPWIGFYRPKATLTGRAGAVEVSLPWLFVLPPTPYVVALVLAVLLPIVVVLRRWRRSRHLDWPGADAHEA